MRLTLTSRSCVKNLKITLTQDMTSSVETYFFIFIILSRLQIWVPIQKNGLTLAWTWTWNQGLFRMQNIQFFPVPG